MENLHIYLRVSTDSQIEDGFGIQNQKDLGIRISKKLEMKPIIHNEGSKSSNSDLIEERPILNELMFKINNGEVKNLWVFNNDRLSRNENVWNTIRLTLRKNGCTLYVSLEPCPMCFYALMQARIHRIVFAAPDTSLGILSQGVFEHTHAKLNHHFSWTGGVCSDLASSELRTFFANRR